MSDYEKEYDQLVDQVLSHIVGEGLKQSKKGTFPNSEISKFIEGEAKRFGVNLNSRFKIMLDAQLKIVEAMLKNPPTSPEE